MTFVVEQMLHDNDSLVSQFLSDHMKILPVTISLPETCTPSAWKTIVPASSILRLDKVKECFFPRTVMRQFPPDLTLTPSLVQDPSTSAWLSSTSRVTVSVSCALVSVKPLITWIFFTEGRRKALDINMQETFSTSHLTIHIQINKTEKQVKYLY